MKKFLSLVLAVIMVVSMAVTAFAANTKLTNDNAGTTAETSILNTLYAAGIIKGEGDKAPSSSATLTRWQVALLALRVYTMIDADGLAKYDLDDSNWANYVVDFGDKSVKYEDCEYPSALGAILFVQEKGFILGYAEDDKTYFRPAQPVTYAEALTIMVRILGWDSPAMNTNWPYNYVEQAAKLGLTKDITKVAMDDQVTYGTFAQLIWNALFASRYQPADKETAEFGHEIGAVAGMKEEINKLATSVLKFGFKNDKGEVVWFQYSGNSCAMDAKYAELDAAYEAAKAVYEEKEAAYDTACDAYDASKDDLDDAEEAMNDAKGELDAAQEAYDAAVAAEAAALKAAIDAYDAYLALVDDPETTEGLAAEIASKKIAYYDAKAAYEAAKEAKDAADAAVVDAEGDVSDAEQAVTDAEDALAAAVEALNAATANLEEAANWYNNSDAPTTKFIQGSTEVTISANLTAARERLASAEKAVADAEEALDDAEDDLTDAEDALGDAKDAAADAKAAKKAANTTLKETSANLEAILADATASDAYSTETAALYKAAQDAYDAYKDLPAATEAAKTTLDEKQTAYDIAEVAYSDAVAKKAELKAARSAAEDEMDDAEDAMDDAEDARDDYRDWLRDYNGCSVSNIQANPFATYTLVNNVNKLGNYLYEKNSSGKYDLIAGSSFDLGYFSYAAMTGYLTKNQVPTFVVNGNVISGKVGTTDKSGSDYRARNWFWALYDLDKNGNIIPETRRLALTQGQSRAKENASKNAWYNQAVTGSVAMIYEPMKAGEDIVVITVGEDVYLTHTSAVAGVYEKEYAETLADLLAKVDEKNYVEILSNKELVKKINGAANIYFRQGLYYGGGLGDPDRAMGWFNDWHLNAFSINEVIRAAFGKNSGFELTKEEYQNFMAQAGVVDDSGTIWDEKYESDDCGVDGGQNPKTGNSNCDIAEVEWMFVSGDPAPYILPLAKESGAWDLAVKKAIEASIVAEAEEAANAALSKALDKAIKDCLAPINTEIAGQEFLGWSKPVYVDDLTVEYFTDAVSESKATTTAGVIAINALYGEAYEKTEWVGAEKALGSYVTYEKVDSNGFKTTKEYAHGLVAGLENVDATTLSKAIEYVGTKNATTYGVWLIDTNGDGLFDVGVYANFVPGLAD